jgi:hypothetical protein
VLVLTLASCRTYDYYPRVSGPGGLVPGDQFARYGREQAQAVAIAREFAKARQASSPGALQARADSAVAYSRRQPGVAGAMADPLGHRLTVVFKSGWRLGVVPLAD